MKMSTGKHSPKLHLVLLALLIAVVGFVIWLYTGYLWDDVQDLELIQYLDVLVDGRFVEELKDISLRFRGSSNQRLIDLNASRAAGELRFLPDRTK